MKKALIIAFLAFSLSALSQDIPTNTITVSGEVGGNTVTRSGVGVFVGLKVDWVVTEIGFNTDVTHTWMPQVRTGLDIPVIVNSWKNNILIFNPLIGVAYRYTDADRKYLNGSGLDLLYGGRIGYHPPSLPLTLTIGWTQIANYGWWAIGTKFYLSRHS